MVSSFHSKESFWKDTSHIAKSEVSSCWHVGKQNICMQQRDNLGCQDFCGCIAARQLELFLTYPTLGAPEQRPVTSLSHTCGKDISWQQSQLAPFLAWEEKVLAGTAFMGKAYEQDHSVVCPALQLRHCVRQLLGPDTTCTLGMSSWTVLFIYECRINFSRAGGCKSIFWKQGVSYQQLHSRAPFKMTMLTEAAEETTYNSDITFDLFQYSNHQMKFLLFIWWIFF